jgi:hypothetical protein
LDCGGAVAVLLPPFPFLYNKISRKKNSNIFCGDEWVRGKGEEKGEAWTN